MRSIPRYSQGLPELGLDTAHHCLFLWRRERERDIVTKIEGSVFANSIMHLCIIYIHLNLCAALNAIFLKFNPWLTLLSLSWLATWALTYADFEFASLL